MRKFTLPKREEYPSLIVGVVLIGLLAYLLFIPFSKGNSFSGVSVLSSVSPEISYFTVLKGSSSAFHNRGFYILENESDFVSLYSKMYQGAPVVPVPPAIDFSNYVVVAVFQGDFQTGGHEIQVFRVVDTGSELKIIINEVNPKNQTSFTQISNQPFHFVKIPRTNKKISFESKVYNI